MDKVQMVFIGGTGRSGTTITKKILARHPDVGSLPFKCRFIVDPDGLVDFYTSFTSSWSPYMAHLRIERLSRLLDRLSKEPLCHRILSRLIVRLNRSGKTLSPRIYHGWGWNRHLPRFGQYCDDLIAQLIQFSFPACWVGTNSYRFHPEICFSGPKTKQELAPILGGFIQNVFGDVMRYTIKRVFVESSTWNILFAREILDLVPGAKILHVYRDPRDVVASFCNQRWTPNDKKQGAYWYTALMEHWFEVRSSLPEGSLHEIRFEEFLGAPEAVMKEVCAFIGIPYNWKMLDLDLSRSNIGRWLVEYTDSEKEAVLPILTDVMGRLGYPEYVEPA